LGDKTHGTCSDESHQEPIEIGGVIITASSNVFVNGRQVARLGDIVQTDCGHISYIITASKNVDNGNMVARLGDDIGNGPYSAKIVTSSTDTFN
jgi:uncharacterized Zn-binding protein involved in type VI secretion